jgi:type IV pilus assembly protein PilE
LAFGRGTADMTKRSGLTLLEIVFALTIAGLVSAYAVPTYREYIARGHRQSAITALHALSLRLEVRGIDSEPSASASRGGEGNNLGDGTNGGGSGGESDGGGGESSDENRDAGFAPSHGRAVYRLRIRQGAATSVVAAVGYGYDYVIEAEPLPDGPQATDRCGTYLLDANGRRTNRVSDNTSADDFSGCWTGGRR